MKILITHILIFSSIFCSAQASIEPQKVYSPKKASIYSAVLPGLGQAYNKKYWKIPIIYASLSTTIYFIRENQSQLNKFKNAYQERLNGLEDSYKDIYSDAQLNTIMEYYERNRDVSYILTGVVYFLNILDASVDAHLMDFDISEDLSMRAYPSLMNNSSDPTLTLQLNF